MAHLEYLDVYFSARSFNEDELRGKSAVVIDVLRASSTIIAALSNGARKIIPVEDMDAAMRIARTMDTNDYLLCGEKDGIKIDGYHLGNSPLEYTPEAVAGKTIILNTTNGTKAIKKASLANQLYIGCFLNQNSIIETLKQHDDSVVLLCSGWRGRLSLEDTLFAGSLISKLCGGRLPDNVTDGVKVAFGLYEKFGDNLEEAIQASDHAKRLKGLAPAGDIAFASRIDEFDILPGLKDGILTNLND